MALVVKNQPATSPMALVVKNQPANTGDVRDADRDLRDLGQKTPWRRAWQPTSVFLPGESPWTEQPGGL